MKLLAVIIGVTSVFCGLYYTYSALMANEGNKGNEGKEIKIMALIKANCTDGTDYVLTETGQTTSPGCQKNLDISPVTHVVAADHKSNIAHSSDAVRKSGENKETDKSGIFVYTPVIEITQGTLKGTSMTNEYIYESLDNLKKCGGSKWVIETPPKSVKITVTSNGKTTTCEGSALIAPLKN